MAKNKDGEDEVVISGYLKFSKVIVWVMYIWVMIGVVALSLRVFFLAFSADTSVGFANFIMQLSADYLHPFRSIFPAKEVGETGYLDVSAIFAIIVYLFIAWGFHSLIDYVQKKIDASRTEQEAEFKKKELEKLRQELLKTQQQQKRRTTTTTTTTTTKRPPRPTTVR